MKTELTAIDKVRKLVGMDIAKSRVNLATETLNEGDATIEAEVFEAGEPVMIVNEEDRIPLPVGEYKLDNGMILVVEEEGVIASIGEEVAEEVAEEEAEATEETEEVAASDNKSETPLPKTIIESVTKEMKFSAEDMDAKDLEIAELKAKITELSKVEEVEVELSVAPITHNPENKKEFKGFKYGNNSKLTPAQVIMSKMANIK